MDFSEILLNQRSNSALMILDFNQITKGLPNYQNIQLYFSKSTLDGGDPRSAENRQAFNDQFLELAGVKYLIGRYGEDRLEMLRGSQIAREGRTIHLGIDLFTKDLEPVHAPAAGTIVVVGKELEPHSYGNYVVIEHQEDDGSYFYTFYGHLSDRAPKIGRRVSAGEQFAWLGDYLNNENGGWSRHLHFQLLTEKPSQTVAPIGYSTKDNWPVNQLKFPDPNKVLQLTNI